MEQKFTQEFTQEQINEFVNSAGKGALNIVEEYIAKGIDVNAKDTGGDTALIWAAWNGRTEVLYRLVAVEGIDFNAKDTDGSTALMWAAEKGKTEIVDRLLAVEGIDFNAKDNDGNTALMWAVENGNTEIVDRLLALKGIDVNAKDNKGYTALMRAAKNGRTDSVNILVNKEQLSLEDRQEAKKYYLEIIPKKLSKKIISELKSPDYQLSNPHDFGKVGKEAYRFGQLMNIAYTANIISDSLGNKDYDDETLEYNYQEEAGIMAVNGITAIHKKTKAIDIISKSLLKYSKEELQDIKDSVNEIADNLFYNAIASELRKSGYDPSQTKKLDGKLEEFQKEFREIFTRYFLTHNTINSAVRMSDAWHKNRAGVLGVSYNRDFAKEGEWYRTLPEKEIKVTKAGLEEYTIVNLENAGDLQDEHYRMRHCVDGYVDQCKMENYQVYSIRKNGEAQTTAGFTIENGELELEQNEGYKRRSANAEEKAVVDWLLEEIKSGNIKLQTEKLGEIYIPPEQRKSELENQLGVMLSDFTEERSKANFARIAKVNRSGYYTLGTKFKDSNIEEFLQKTELQTVIDQFKTEVLGKMPHKNLTQTKELEGVVNLNNLIKQIFKD